MHVCCRDEEGGSYMSRPAPAGQPATVQERIVKELKQNWWLWGSVAFAVLLIGSLVVFRNSLYDTAAHGLPFLAGERPLLLAPRHPLSFTAW